MWEGLRLCLPCKASTVDSTLWICMTEVSLLTREAAAAPNTAFVRLQRNQFPAGNLGTIKVH